MPNDQDNLYPHKILTNLSSVFPYTQRERRATWKWAMTFNWLYETLENWDPFAHRDRLNLLKNKWTDSWFQSLGETGELGNKDPLSSKATYPQGSARPRWTQHLWNKVPTAYRYTANLSPAINTGCSADEVQHLSHPSQASSTIWSTITGQTHRPSDAWVQFPANQELLNHWTYSITKKIWKTQNAKTDITVLAWSFVT